MSTAVTAMTKVFLQMRGVEDWVATTSVFSKQPDNRGACAIIAFLNPGAQGQGFLYGGCETYQAR